MAGAAGGLNEDPLVLRCFPQLVFAEETTDLKDKIMAHECFSFRSSFACNDPKMLCFGGFKGGVATNSGQESGSICMDCTPLSSTLPKSNKKRKWSGDEPDTNPGSLSRAPTGSGRSSKKAKSSDFTAHHAKIVKKEKLGERITALQQLVSPFGKSDTASVLHEALGYIRFLQDQVQVLCSPYLHRHNRPAGTDRKAVNCREKNMDLRSKGLSLVPIELTLHVADESNGADLWSSVAMVDNVSLFRL
ncbi:transcription factor bHLH111-like [Primulina tabacum]|uniref:transcription factor bHLH111-like n=1 Tax=Primulina tabacum TaxID=48773 RepID=UPI003F5A0E1A